MTKLWLPFLWNHCTKLSPSSVSSSKHYKCHLETHVIHVPGWDVFLVVEFLHWGAVTETYSNGNSNRSVLLLHNELSWCWTTLCLSGVKRSFRCSTVCPDPLLLLPRRAPSPCRRHNEQRVFVRLIISIIFSNSAIIREQWERSCVWAERTGTPCADSQNWSFSTSSLAWPPSRDSGVCGVCGSLKCLTLHLCSEHWNTSLSVSVDEAQTLFLSGAPLWDAVALHAAVMLALSWRVRLWMSYWRRMKGWGSCSFCAGFGIYEVLSFTFKKLQN